MEEAAKYFSNIIRQRKKNWPVPVEYLGGGRYGKAFKTNNGRVMKIQPLTKKANAFHEFKILKKLKGTGVAPSVKNGNINRINIKNDNIPMLRKLNFPNNKKVLNAFVMGRVGSMTLNEYYKRFYPNKRPYETKVFKYVTHYIHWLAQQLHRKGVLHSNIHGENIMVSVNSKGEITGMWVIDFGLAKYFPIGTRIPGSWNFPGNLERLRFNISKLINKLRVNNQPKSPLRKTRSVSSTRRSPSRPSPKRRASSVGSSVRRSSPRQTPPR